MALEILHATNNFPEFTGRLCPAPCEEACVLQIIKPAVAIENIEKNIVEKGFSEGWIVPNLPKKRTGRRVAVVGSGPAGLAAAQQLNRAGHSVCVLERDNAIGGLLRYGIPDFKLEKHIIDRRVAILKAEGIAFKTNVEVGKNYGIENLQKFDAVLLCCGASIRRTLPFIQPEVKGIVQAMDFLTQQNQRVSGVPIRNSEITAAGKHVIVIGGGDTGSDCIGTSRRQGALSVTNFEIMPMPPHDRSEKTPWPYWALRLRNSSSHEEGCDRNWLISTKEFITNQKGELEAVKAVRLEYDTTMDKPQFKEVANTEKIWKCDLALLAMGFTGAETTLSEKLGLEIDQRSNYKANNYQTKVPHIFTAGDMRRGQSLIVWAISEGREAARQIDIFLMGESELPSKGKGDLVSVAD